MDFLPRELIAQLELYQHSFHETILCLLGTPHCFSHLSQLSLTHHSVFSLYIWNVSSGCVTSYKYVAASSALDWATESWVRPARPGAATCHCSLHSPASPCSDQFHLSPASPALPPAQPVASGALLNPCLSLPGTWSSQWQPKRFLHGWGKYSNNTLLISTKTV